MSTKPSDKYIQKVENCLMRGYPIKSCNMTTEGRLRLKICKEVYNLFIDNPMIDMRETVRNIARRYNIDRSPAELANDIYVVNHIISFMELGNRNIEKRKVEYASDWLMRTGMSSGNDRAVTSGAKLKMTLNDNFSDETKGFDNLAEMPIVITTDVSVVKPGVQNYTDEEKRELFEKYSLSRKEMEILLENNNGVYETAPVEEEPEPDMFIESED